MRASLPQIWIDATCAASGLSVWGMTPVERLVREAARRGAKSVRVWLTDESAAAGARAQRADLARLYDVATAFELVADNGSLYDELGQARESVLLLEGDAIYDDRILTFLLAGNSDNVVSTPDGVAAAFVSPAGAGRLAQARADSGPSDRSLAALARRARLQVRGPQDLPEYVPSLRLTLRAFAVRLGEPGQVRAVENLMYRRTFKGVIDAVAKYGYYHVVRSITRVLARTELTPNLFTLLSIIGIWAAVPAFAAGFLGAGVVAAWSGVILDSVDGKLARLPCTSATPWERSSTSPPPSAWCCGSPRSAGTLPEGGCSRAGHWRWRPGR